MAEKSPRSPGNSSTARHGYDDAMMLGFFQVTNVRHNNSSCCQLSANGSDPNSRAFFLRSDFSLDYTSSVKRVASFSLNPNLMHLRSFRLVNCACSLYVCWFSTHNQQVCRSFLYYCRAEMYAGRVECRLLVIHGENADGTDRQTDRRTDARPLHYAFRYKRLA